MLTDLDRHRPLELYPTRTKEAVAEKLAHIPEATRNSVVEIAIDMWRPYADLARQLFPKAKIVIDHFHVIQALNDDLKRLKIKRLKENQNAPLIRKAHYPLLKNKADLTPEQQRILEKLRPVEPIIAQAYDLKNAFQEIFATTTDQATAAAKIEDWLQQARSKNIFQKFAQTLVNWKDSILNFFDSRTTNAATEGINTKLKRLARNAAGILNPEHLRLRALAAFWP